MKKSRSALPLVIFAVCMVSYSGPMVKGALMEGASPVSVALIRMLLAGVILLPLNWMKCKKQQIPFRITLREGLWILLSAFFLATHYLTWITSLQGTSTFASVALVCTQPLFVAFFSYFLFGERMPSKAWFGALLALFGALTIALSGMMGSDTGDGSGALSANLLALLGAMLMAGHWLTSRHICQFVHTNIYTPILYFMTAFILATSLPLLGGFCLPTASFGYMAGLIIGCTLLGHAVFSYTLTKVSVNVVSFALLGEPVGAMIFSMLFFGEIPTVPVALGGTLTLLGLWRYLYATHQSNDLSQTVSP